MNENDDERQGKSTQNYDDSFRIFQIAFIAGVAILGLLAIEMIFWPT